MRARFIKYGKSIKNADGSFEHLEISLELQPHEYEEEAIDRAKKFIKKNLVEQQNTPLTGSIGEQLAAKGNNHGLKT